MLIRLFFVVFCEAACNAKHSTSTVREVTDDNAVPEGVTGTFTGVDNVSIAYKIVRHPQSVASVVILSGYTESYLLYDELIQDFYRQNYSVYIMDNRGMGLSGRLLSNPQIVH